MKIKALIIVWSILFSANIYGQTRECDYCGEPCICDTVIVHDTIVIHDTVYISNLDSVTKYFDLTFDEYVECYLRLAKEHDTINPPLSPTMVYLNYFLPMLENTSDKEKRWIQDIFTIQPLPKGLNLTKSTINLSDSLKDETTTIDLLIQCEGSKSADYFLTSQKLIDTCLVQLFTYIADVNSQTNNKIQGINFYFPQFLFKEKRAMAQFAKSVSLIIDKSDFNYLKLYFSFDKAEGLANSNYLNCIASIVDTIMLIDNTNKHTVFANYTVITNKTDIPLFSKIKNQFYLARFYAERYTQLTCSNELLKIAHSDYYENNWESYLFALSIVIIIIILIFILYWTIPSFSYYLNKNSDYMIILVLMLALEIILLSFIMVENMSKDFVFKFSEENKNIFLFMPLVLIFLAPIIKIMRNKKNLP